MANQYEIENDILDYFADAQGVGRGTINRNTDLKSHFGYNDAAWASEAKPLSRIESIRRLNVEIAQSEMSDHVSAKALAALVCSKARGAPFSASLSLSARLRRAPKKSVARKKPSKKGIRRKRASRNKKRL